MISERTDIQSIFNETLEELNLSKDDLPQNLNEEI